MPEKQNLEEQRGKTSMHFRYQQLLPECVFIAVEVVTGDKVNLCMPQGSAEWMKSGKAWAKAWIKYEGYTHKAMYLPEGCSTYHWQK